MELRTNSHKPERFRLNSQSPIECHSELTRTCSSAASENMNSVSVEGFVITDMNTQTESILEMIPKFWILYEHLYDIRDDPKVIDPPKHISTSTVRVSAS